jgi:recombination protein RecA
VGDSSTGKTLNAIEALANFKIAFPKGRMRYAEAEAAFDESFAEQLGFPPEVERPDELLSTVEEFRDDFNKFIEKGGPGLYILDSLDALSDSAELDKYESDMKEAAKAEAAGRVFEAKGSYGATKAKQMAQFFRMLTRDAKKNNCTLGIISQVRDNIGVMFGEKETRSGGRALQFYCSQVIWLSDHGKQTREVMGEKRPIGVEISAKVTKNKVGYPFRVVDYNITFGYGIDNEQSMLDWLLHLKAMTAESAKELKKQLTKAREKQDYKTIHEIADSLIADSKRTWKKIEDELAPKIRKYGH